MAVKFNKENKAIKARTSKPGKLCSLTLTFEIITSVLLGFVALAPFLSGLAGITLGVIMVALAVLITVFTMGTGWASPGVRNFFGSGFNVAGKILDGTTKIIPVLREGNRIIYIALSMFAVALLGFVYNLIYFIKHDKANKGRFITSCIFLGLAILNLILALVIYLATK